jgi:hypothetical protein
LTASLRPPAAAAATILLGATVLAALARPAAGVPSDGPDGPRPFEIGTAAEIVRDGAWLRDKEGRYLVFRGVNLASPPPVQALLPAMPAWSFAE